MNFEKATNYINAVKKQEQEEQERVDLEEAEEHRKWVNSLREEYNNLISKIEKYYTDIVEDIENKPENINMKDYDDSLTFHNYTYVEDIKEERDPYGGLKDRVILDSDKNIKELNALLRVLYRDMDLDRTRFVVLSEVLKEHGMRIRANIRIEQRYPCHHPFKYCETIEDTFIISSCDVDFMKHGDYTSLVITMNFPYVHDFHKFTANEFYKPFDSNKAKNGAILYYSFKLVENTYMADHNTVKYHFTKYF